MSRDIYHVETVDRAMIHVSGRTESGRVTFHQAAKNAIYNLCIVYSGIFLLIFLDQVDKGN